MTGVPMRNGNKNKHLHWNKKLFDHGPQRLIFANIPVQISKSMLYLGHVF